VEFSRRRFFSFPEERLIMLQMVERILGWNVPEETNGQEGEM
jgi:hypothetical protein